MKNKIEKELSPKEIADYDPEFEGGIQIKDEYATKEQVRELIIRIYKSTHSAIKTSNIRNKHEALLTFDKAHCSKEIEKIKIAICENEIGALWIKEGCPKFPEWANSLIDSKVYNWINDGVKKWYVQTIFGERSDFDERNFRYNIYELDVIDEKIVPFFKMYFEIIVLQNIIKREGIDPSKTIPLKKAGRPPIIPKEFKDYLAPTAPKEMMETLRSLLVGKKGKAVAVVIRALIEGGFIESTTSPPTGRELYSSMRKHFGDIGKNSGIAIYHTGGNKDEIKERVIETIKKLQKIQ